MSTCIPTGNEYVCLPSISESDGSIETLNVVLMKLDGLLEICGAPGRPLIACPGLKPASWSFREDWIPMFTAAGGEGVICAPPGERFFFVKRPAGAAAPHFRLSLGDVFQTANIRHKLPRCEFHVRMFGWAQEVGLMIDLYAGTLLASLAIRCPSGAAFAVEDAAGREELTWGRERITPGPLHIDVACSGEPVLVVGVNQTSIGAMSANLEVGRVPVAEWLARAERWLAKRRVEIPAEPELARKANRNGHFARFFAMARTMDTGETVSMTSRSYRYYVSSAYWDRDSLLWLFPFLLKNDKALAEELLRYAFGRQLPEAGIHSRYISGRVLEFGFELDELLAPLTALAAWHKRYPGEPVWEEESVRRGVVSLLERLKERKDEATGLYRTELMPTDDRIDGGRDLLTYDNALAVHTLGGLLPILMKISPDHAAFARAEAPAIHAAVCRHLIRDNLFMWSMDSAGRAEKYDEAAGSLILLPYYGFCPPCDPVYLKTLAYLYSSECPYCQVGPFGELGNRHTGTPHPWVLSACNSVLGGARVKEGLDFLRRAPMDNGIACESVNLQTGAPETGLHFATCAGFVAHTIVYGTRS